MKREEAIFAAGCFWGVEKVFLDVPGVIDAESGYTGGHTENPTYEQTCSGNTGHAEAVRVTYDADAVSYETLVRRFFEIHNPTEVNRQGPDAGSQYRSAIFYLDEGQKGIAQSTVKELTPKYYPRTIATEIVLAATFYRAEEYHQRYFEKHPNLVCHIG